MNDYILSIDQGTTGTTAALFSMDMKPVAIHKEPLRQIFPASGWVEQDPEDIFETVRRSVKKVLAAGFIDGGRVVSIGITNQRETVIVWDREGRPITNAIVWQCRRTTSMCDELKKEGLEEVVRDKTGLVIDPYFSGTKIRWLIENMDGLFEKAKRGDALFGTVDSFLIYRLTCGRFYTDVSNGSRTLLMDIKKLDWDDELLNIFHVPRIALAEIVPSSFSYGEVRGFLPELEGVPITGVAGDQQAALFGQGAFEKGMGKCTYGTGAFLLINTGSTPLFSRKGILTTIAWKLDEGETIFALEGSSFIAGALIDWLKDGLGVVSSPAEVDNLASSVDSSDGLIFIPGLVGLGAPHWVPEARGVLAGIHRGTTRGHIVRASLEGIAHLICDLIEAINEVYGEPIQVIKVDGGASMSDILMQFQSDITGITIKRPFFTDVTSLGAAMLSAIGSGIYRGVEELSDLLKVEREFKPSINEAKRREIRVIWKEWIEKCKEIWR